MRVELLYFDGCPSHEQLLPRMERLLEDAGAAAPIELRRIESPEAAEAQRFLGSPTVRIDGDDVEPGAGSRRDYGLKCRLYRSGGGASGLPPDAWIRSALERARRQEGAA